MAPPTSLNLTKEQSSVVGAPASARIFVEAGPGTGKTAVACARVAKLLDEDCLNPGSILMISFTRTAVAEMKNRLRLLSHGIGASSVNVLTLDQAAFSFGVGIGTRFEELMGSFEGNIDRALAALEANNPLLNEFLGEIGHLIIDEAQDLTCHRSQLVRRLLSLLPSEAGVSIFADPEQAIYGFTNDLGDDRSTSEQFLTAFDPSAKGYEVKVLTKNHRTKNDAIHALFAKAREAVRHGEPSIMLEVARAAGKGVGKAVERLPIQHGDLLLYRTRASALHHAQFCPRLFRIRLPGHPSALYPWIGLTLSTWEEPKISEDDFSDLWEAHVPDVLHDGFDQSSAWELLLRFSKHQKDRSKVDLLRLRDLLSPPRPRVEFCYMDYGGHGPIFSTIHASKGREADRVMLMLNDPSGKNCKNPAEEARVCYVGMTRVGAEFMHGNAPHLWGAGKLDSSGQRTVHITKGDWRPKFQVGLQDDFDDQALVSSDARYGMDMMAAIHHQEHLLATWQKALQTNQCPAVNGKLVRLQGNEYRYLFKSEDAPMAWSGHRLAHDLWTACKRMKECQQRGNMKPPDELEYLRMIGIRTCVAPNDPVVTSNLQEPYATSGFWVAPMIVGFPSIFLKFAKSK